MRLAICVLTFSLGGCLTTAVPDHGEGRMPPSDSELQQMLASGSFRGAGWKRVDQQTYPTEIADQEWIDVYASLDAEDDYRAISPEQTHDGLPFPVGGTIVRVVYDANGKPMKLT